MPIFAGMKRLRLLLLLLLAAVTTAQAQRQLVVADIETGEIVARANVEGTNFHAVTDSAGCFSAPDSCRTLLFSHVNYESRMVNMQEVAGDTIFIISKLLNLKEVVVFGKLQYEDDGLDDLRKSLRMQRTEAQLAAADPSKASLPLGLLAKLLPKKWRPGYKSEQRRRRHEEILRNY